MKTLRLRHLGIAACAAIVATTGLVLVAEPALAIPGRVVVTSTTASNSTSPKGGLLACPAGTVPVGGGGAINSAAPGITIVQDNPGPTGWLFAAIEQTGGVASSWSLTTWAVCATAPAGYQVIVANGTIAPKTPAVATCPGSKKVIGAGATLETPVGDNARVIESIRPNPALTSVTASAVLDPFATTGPASNVVHAYAVCINPQPGQVLVTANSASNSTNKTMTATCPAPTVPQGVGATVRTGGGQVNLTTLSPAANPATVSAVERAGGFGGNWVLQAFAICLR